MDADIEDAIKISSISYFYTKYGPFKDKKTFNEAKNNLTIWNMYPENGVFMAQRNEYGAKVKPCEIQELPGKGWRITAYSRDGKTNYCSAECSIDPVEFTKFHMCRSCGCIVDPEFQVQQMLCMKITSEDYEREQLDVNTKLGFFCNGCIKWVENKTERLFNFVLLSLTIDKLVSKLEFLEDSDLKELKLVEGSRTMNPARIIKSVGFFKKSRAKVPAAVSSSASPSPASPASPASPTVSSEDPREKIMRRLREFRDKLVSERKICEMFVEEIMTLVPEVLQEPNSNLDPLEKMIERELKQISEQMSKMNLSPILNNTNSKNAKYYEVERIPGNTVMVKTINSSILSYNLKVKIYAEESERVLKKCEEMGKFVGGVHENCLKLFINGQFSAFEQFSKNVLEIIKE